MRTIAAREFAGVPLYVDSAGTADYHVGEPPDRRTVAAARRRGFELASLRARRIARSDFENFDYILAMDRANLEALESLGEGVKQPHVGLFMEFAPQLGLDEVPDPYHGGIEEFERVLDLCESGARGLMQKLAARK